MSCNPAPPADKANSGMTLGDTDIESVSSECLCTLHQLANALTAILLHAEAIGRRAASMSASDDDDEIGSSARHIVVSAKQVWDALGKSPAPRKMEELRHGTQTLARSAEG